MAVDYLQEYLGIDPNDYSAMEQRIAGVSPVGQSIIPRLGRTRTPIKRPIFVGGPPDALPIRPIRPILRKEPTPDFGSQISGLEEQIAKLTEQMSLLETEKQKALEDQDIMRAELAQAQQDALAEQGEQFATERSALEQQIADLTAQIGQQPPGGGQETGGGQGPIGDEGGLPEGYSYTSPQDMAYTAVPPEPGFRYAYGPDGDRIQVPDERKIPKEIDYGYGPGIMPPLPPREELIPQLRVPPKKDDQLFIDDRPPDPRLNTTRGVPIGGNVPGGGGIDYGGPQPIPLVPVGGGTPVIKEPSPIAPPAQRPIGRPPLRREEPIPLRPREELINEGFIEPTIANTGTRGIIGKNPVVSSGIGGIGARPSMPKPPQRPFFGKMIDRQPRQPMSVGGVGGISGRRSMRPMMRAGGGAIGQAIADLQNRLR
jgi:hypothetical protein